MQEEKAMSEKFVRLAEVMKRLRAPDGCPWDREQDYMSLRRYIIEEAYELIQAIESENIPNMCEECGDLMLQVVFISCMAEERGDFTISNVMDGLTNKLIRRHPHVFGDISVKDSDDVLRNWEQIKSAERRGKEEDSSYMAGIPRGMPALLRAYRIQERAAKPGFDWPKGDVSPVVEKVEEELAELKEAMACKGGDEIAEELGDLIFAAVNLSRHLGIDPEINLHRACEKFDARFRSVEKSVEKSGRPWKDYTLDELDAVSYTHLPLLALLPDARQARDFAADAEELGLFGSVKILPEMTLAEDDSRSEAQRIVRGDILENFKYKGGVLAVTPASLMAPFSTGGDYIELECGKEVGRSRLIDWLARKGYERCLLYTSRCV